MENRKIKTIIILSLVVAYILSYTTFLYELFPNISQYITATATIVMSCLAASFFGIKRDKITSLKKNVIVIVAILLLAFFGIYYGSGLILGYLQTPYQLNLESLFINIVPTIISIIGIELFRYIMINKSQSKAESITTTVIICILELAIALTGTALVNAEETFKISTQLVLPIIAKNYVFTYLTRHSGLKPILFYRLIMDTYIYIVPIVPDVGDYLNASIKIALPMILLIISYRQIDDTENGIEYDFKKQKIRKADIPIILFIIAMSILISGKFDYYMIGIGSDSMAPRLKKGDAVVLSQSKKKNYKKDDIVAFKSNGKLIIHRIIEVKTKDGKYFYKTQGDANITPDALEITNNDIVGIVKFRIKYIGYPSILLSETTNK